MGKSSRRFYRSFIISLGSLGVLLWVVFDQFEVPREEIAELVFGTLGVIGTVIVLAALFAGILILVRKRGGRHSDE